MPVHLVNFMAVMEIFCPNLTAPAGGSVEFNSRIGERAHYSCSPRLVLVGEETQLCQADGDWSGEEPVCVSQCPDLPDPLRGMVNISGCTPGSTACYTCVAEFEPTTMCRTCLISGEWSGGDITCESKESMIEVPSATRKLNAESAL